MLIRFGLEVPFASDNYTGGNPSEEKHSALAGIRQWIFRNGTGNVTELLGSGANYGSYQVLGNISVSFDVKIKPDSYRRSLNLETGMHTTSFVSENGTSYDSTVFCSYPDSVCVYSLRSTATLPDISVKVENQLVSSTLANPSCVNNYAQLKGITQVGPPKGMQFNSIARILGSSHNSTRCSQTDAGAVLVPSSSAYSVELVIGAGTDYDQTKGNVANKYSFRGKDPESYVQNVTATASSKSLSDLQNAHLEDFKTHMQAFTLSLPDLKNLSSTETSILFAQYTSGIGNPFIESLLFDLSRYLLVSSSRSNSLPANLQGRWSEGLSAAWSADYHANINLQMNYWVAEQTGIGGSQIQDALWRYMKDTWVPRGMETARLMYGAPGWVTHSEMNIFGHTAMKESAKWTNYPAAAAWMMQHVTDHFSYSQDVSWLKETGYPLLKGTVQFWLSQLQADTHWDDNSIVVNPCNSPEIGPTTFGCTIYQHQLHQLLGSITVLGSIVGDDTTFLSNVTHTLERLDKGFHLTSWGGIKEWKLPTALSATYDPQNNTHRHLSPLWGWYPGLSLISTSAPYLGGYTNSSIQKAVETELYSRGPGNGPDANAGWEKVWRSACWARLNNTERAYFELKYAVEQNFVGNALSMYSGKNTPFQIDANFGFGGAVLAMLVVDIEEPAKGSIRTVVLGPAIPKEWAGGSVRGLRLRGGGTVDFSWDKDGVVDEIESKATGVRFVDKYGKVLLSTKFALSENS